jgi:hypothetical protein
VNPAAGEEIARLAGALARTGDTERPEQPPLGHRGVWLRAPDGREWSAGGGVVVDRRDVRTDTEHAVERAILATAPKGVLPDWSATSHPSDERPS